MILDGARPMKERIDLNDPQPFDMWQPTTSSNLPMVAVSHTHQPATYTSATSVSSS